MVGTMAAVGDVNGGAAASAGWAAPLLVAGLIASAIAVGLILRERYHRRRRDELQRRLADLESILIGISAVPKAEPADPSSSRPIISEASAAYDDVAPRGPLSTAISTLRHDQRPGPPGPDRIDLRSTFFVYDHLDRPLTPSDLADGLNLSLRSLQRGLAASLGCTPRELILAVKMREAKRRLIDEGFRVQEAARAVGFDDPFHFSRRFKAYYRVSPSELPGRRDRSVA